MLLYFWCLVLCVVGWVVITYFNSKFERGSIFHKIGDYFVMAYNFSFIDTHISQQELLMIINRFKQNLAPTKPIYFNFLKFWTILNDENYNDIVEVV